ncbi:M56 family metallopeptidase [Terriglobus saanensis]|uniref:Peptidase M56 BlaR1 n=1 Tax=Terriglobus saanensis (strain ATCC BAA-1853 / DSM 23119 / SP1PR4) TaxID=401053 RepID=E8V038_TERSS|nr:M56 family metallopeptidase [Terriglobus saanensis]ADV82193.1 peptidase M56 BlaR1 [Terriglobus saanensis SP1PR4]
MNALTWMRDGEMVALGWTLLHFCWQGTAIAVVYALVDRMTFRAAAKVRYGIAMVALGLMPVAALVTFVEQERLVVHLPRGGQEVVASQLGAIHSTLVKELPQAAPMLADSELFLAGSADRLLPWVDGVWLAGVLLLALRAVGGWWQLEHLRRRAEALVPTEVEASFLRISQQLRMGRKVALRLSDELISPMAMGVWRATVILPVSAVMQLEPAQLEAVLAHELAHIRRWDYLCNLLQTTVECLLFFHPAVWWVSRRTRDLREVCCDEVAARTCESPVVYAEALLQLEEQRTERLQLAMALEGHRGTLLIRVRQILGEGMIMERRTTSGTRVAIIGAVVLALLLGSKAANGLKVIHRSVSSAVVAQQDVSSVTSVRVSAPAVVKSSTGDADVQADTSPNVVAEMVASTPMPAPTPAPMATPNPAPTPGLESDEETPQGGANYLQRMKDAGYPLDLNRDLDTIISLRNLGVTPEYAKGMAQVGLGTPTLHELTGLKAQGVTPEYLQGLRSSGIAPTSFHEAISEKAVGVTPEYSREIAALGIGTPTTHDLISLRAQGITPEYVAELKASGLVARDLHELAGMKAVGVNPEYAKAMMATGYPDMTPHELVSLRAQGVTPEYARWVKQSFPNADMHSLRQGGVFHVDADFVAKAKAHGFTDTSFDKLVKLKMTGLLD